MYKMLSILKPQLSIFRFVINELKTPMACCNVPNCHAGREISLQNPSKRFAKLFYLRNASHINSYRLAIVKRLNEALTDSVETRAILYCILYFINKYKDKA